MVTVNWIKDPQQDERTQGGKAVPNAGGQVGMAAPQHGDPTQT